MQINQPKHLDVKGPVLLAANHPNSFLDAILLCTLFRKPIYSLARGDVFKKKWVAKLLKSLNMFPVFRISEGSENIGFNYETFDQCIHLFKNDGIVLIFSEGLCVNEWHLRKLKKGTARLALNSWQNNIPLSVIPVGINYSSFNRFGKNIHINFGEPILFSSFDHHLKEGVAILKFNELLTKELQSCVYEIPLAEFLMRKEKFHHPTPAMFKILLGIPAILGYLVHAPIVWLAKLVFARVVKDKDHYDSVLVGTLFLIYPIFLITLFISLAVAGYANIGLLLFFVLPFTAWSYVQLKEIF